MPNILGARKLEESLSLLPLWQELLADLTNEHGNPKFVEEGVAAFIDTKVMDVDEEFLQSLERAIEEGTVPSESVSMRDLPTVPNLCEHFTSGQLYFDRRQRCLYQYYQTEPKSGVLVVPVRHHAQRNKRALVVCAHLRSGSSIDEEHSRKSQLQTLEGLQHRIDRLWGIMDEPNVPKQKSGLVQRRSVGNLDADLVDPDQLRPMLIGMDVNTEVRYEHELLWKWNHEKEEYLSTEHKRLDGTVFQLLKDKEHAYVLKPSKGKPTVLKERGFHSGQPEKQGVPVFDAVDVFCIWNQSSASSKIVPIKGEKYAPQVNDLPHMIPNALEPSDHKAVVAWVEWFS